MEKTCATFDLKTIILISIGSGILLVVLVLMGLIIKLYSKVATSAKPVT
ncbi:PREDICTED: protein FAM24A-like [Chrysochloris asiatica]|uniref:Protein FAM24A-like n=1 Tax=Chrysochloris asiatica TaxID=185453 RepID=A0A9B0WRN3_CHRAS|nr:PREDICTED: protein FAM24A-like [Chrysochloris asiatica]